MISESELQRSLQTIGIESLCQWDVLIFLYRHRTTLMAAERMARLMGYSRESVIAAVNVLETRHLVERSPKSYGPRVCQFTLPSAPALREAVERLLAASDSREGRLVLSKYLRRGERSPQEGADAARRFATDAKRMAQIAEHRSREMRLFVLERMDRLEHQKELTECKIKATSTKRPV